MTLAELYERLSAIGRGVLPDEACGLLIGDWPLIVDRSTADLPIKRIVPMANCAGLHAAWPDATSTFVMDHDCLRYWVRRSSIRAAWHTHTAENARPSELDAEIIRAIDWPMIIVRPGMELRIFRKPTTEEGPLPYLEVAHYAPREGPPSILCQQPLTPK